MKIKLTNPDPEKNVLTLLKEEGIVLNAYCGGNGRCGKCKVIIDGREVPACRTFKTGTFEVTVPEASAMENMQIVSGGEDIKLSSEDTAGTKKPRRGIAYDIGTTTVSALMYDLDTGKLLDGTVGANAQVTFGADVVARIQAANEGNLEKEVSVLRDQLDRMKAFLSKGKPVEKCVIACNTIMEHFAEGLNPASIGVPPFKPESLFGYERIINGVPTYLAPCVSGYVGSDITAGLAACGGLKAEGLWLYVDVGTNGEIAVGNRDGFMTCATAAGPAFEGAETECGMPALPGAIDHVTFENGAFRLHTIGGTAPKGICGSGLIDIVACLVKNGLIKPNGAFVSGEERLYFTEEIYLSRKDIMALMYGKAAIKAGIETLLHSRGEKAEDITKVIIAGGFGNFIDCESAVTIGLLPETPGARKIKAGNASLKGASQLLFDVAPAVKMASGMTYGDLSTSREFTDFYIDAMNFE